MQLPQIPGLKKVSSAWAFPCCGCGCFGLIVIILVMAFSATFSRHVGEESLLAGPISMVCVNSLEGHTLDEVGIINNQAKVSWFGRPDSPSFCRDPDDNIYGAYVGEKPDGCHLNDPDDYYAAVYDPQHPPRNWWGKKQLLVKYKDKSVVVTIVDHGPHPSTGRQLDLSYAAFKSLGVSTDSVVEVCFPGGGAFAKGGSINVPCINQDQGGHCGRASTAMLIAYYTGRHFRTSDPPFPGHLQTILNQYTGGRRWCRGSDFASPSQFQIITQSLSRGNPVLFYSGRYKSRRNQYGHIMVMTGYDASTDTVMINNPKTWWFGGCKKERHHRIQIINWGYHSTGHREFLYVCR